MNNFPDRLETGEILLRPMAESDRPTLIRQLGDPEIACWMAAVRRPFGSDEADEILALGRDPSRRIRVLETDGAMVGCLCLSPDLWFWLDPAAQGRGLMSRALRAAISAQFSTPAPPLLATCRDDNTPSQALLSALGFSRRPTGRRMFFQGEGRALPCHGYVMTPEQWLLLHPPVLCHGTLTLRPAQQKDAPMLPRPRPDASHWPLDAARSVFIETHRCRTPSRGLFVLEDANRRIVGMVLLDGTTAPPALYQTPQDEARYVPALAALLRETTG